MFWRKKKMISQHVFYMPQEKSPQELVDEARAAVLLAEEKAKKAKEERLRNLEADPLELLAEREKKSDTSNTVAELSGLFGLAAWMPERITLRSRIKDLAREVGNERSITVSPPKKKAKK